ncbi:MAG: proline--tRNA ligase [Magnetococcales bacterium]|nr:proline--tRNA ligase [Magnetococcales bacterium]
MRFHLSLIPTLKENPVDAHVVSHRLMLRAGLIRQLTTGIYNWLPLGLRVLRKVEAIVRQEMDAAGAQEILMPAVQPAELWEESGRWQHYGRELLRITDRHDRPFCFGPTHEEVVTDLVRREIKSYKQLPINLYQIQTKFRDEIRPRFGIMRGREFLMKDAYSFDVDTEGLDRSYQGMFAAYEHIFRRCGLRFRAVEADTGAIGGASSHEFHVLADSGEDIIASCARCGYAANLEKAQSGPLSHPAAGGDPLALTEVATPGQKSIEQVAAFLKVSPQRTVKALALVNDQGDYALLLLRGDHELNPIKAAHLLGGTWEFPTPERLLAETGLPAGYLGPVLASGVLSAFGKAIEVVADEALQGARNMVCGANREGFHLVNVNWDRGANQAGDLPEPRFADLRQVEAGDPCPRCPQGVLARDHGIEVGHVFKLGYKYSQAMNVRILDQEGREQHPIMGCYGIGVSRIVAAAIEQNHDDNGIIWPVALAPFAVEILLVNPKDAQAATAAEALYAELRRTGLEALLDDRDERIGVKFKDADLLGIPFRVLVGGRSLKEGYFELQSRRGGEPERVPPAEMPARLAQRLADLERTENSL